MGILDQDVSAKLLERLETKVDHMGSPPYLYDGAPIKTLYKKAQVSFPAWEYAVCFITHHYWKEWNNI